MENKGIKTNSSGHIDISWQKNVFLAECECEKFDNALIISLYEAIQKQLTELMQHFSHGKVKFTAEDVIIKYILDKKSNGSHVVIEELPEENSGMVQ